jgi:hypothetical protein
MWGLALGIPVKHRSYTWGLGIPVKHRSYMWGPGIPVKQGPVFIKNT